MRFILASQSPRRKELLKIVLQDFETVVSGADETLEEGLTPEKQATKISYTKAKAVFDETTGNRIVIASDTMVVKCGKIYGKPKNNEEAKKMLKELINGDKAHDVITGLTVLIQKNDKYEEYKTYDKTRVYLKNMSDEEIENWIRLGKATDRAGAYGIQDEFSVFVEKIEGNYTTVIGLPIHKVYEYIKDYIVE